MKKTTEIAKDILIACWKNKKLDKKKRPYVSEKELEKQILLHAGWGRPYTMDLYKKNMEKIGWIKRYNKAIFRLLEKPQETDIQEHYFARDYDHISHLDDKEEPFNWEDGSKSLF